MAISAVNCGSINKFGWFTHIRKICTENSVVTLPKIYRGADNSPKQPLIKMLHHLHSSFRHQAYRIRVLCEPNTILVFTGSFDPSNVVLHLLSEFQGGEVLAIFSNYFCRNSSQ